jgi:Family of unknown function (DUF5636)
MKLQATSRPAISQEQERTTSRGASPAAQLMEKEARLASLETTMNEAWSRKQAQPVVQRTQFNLGAVADNYAEGSEQKKILQDLERVQTFLLEGHSEALAYLESQLQARLEKNQSLSAPDPYKKILSEELADKEGRSGFPEGVPIYWKVLSPKAFTTMAESGHAFKDVGAGFQHGEQTHRIQWYIALYNWTKGFEEGFEDNLQKDRYGFNFSPSELFKKVNLSGINISNESLWPRREVSGFGGLWDAVFDRNNSARSLGTDDLVTSPEAFNATLMNPSIAKYPDVKIRNSSEGIGAWADQYKVLSTVLTRRFEKRRQMEPENETNFKEYRAKKIGINSPKHEERWFGEDNEKENGSGVLIPI